MTVTLVEGDVTLRDSLGNEIGSIADTSSVRRVQVEAMPFAHAIAAGLIPGGTAGQEIAWFNAAGTGAVLTYGTTYTQPTSGGQWSISSSSTADAAAGSGARTVKISGYTSSWVWTEEIVTMNGTSWVNLTTTNMQYLGQIQVVTQGTAAPAGNTGTLTLRSAPNGGGSVIQTLGAGGVRTFNAHHYVPPGRKCFVTSMRAGATSQNGIVYLTYVDPTVTTPANNYQTTTRYGSGNQTNSIAVFDPPIVITGPALIRGEAYGDATNTAQRWFSFNWYELPA